MKKIAGVRRTIPYIIQKIDNSSRPIEYRVKKKTKGGIPCVFLFNKELGETGQGARYPFTKTAWNLKV